MNVLIIKNKHLLIRKCIAYMYMTVCNLVLQLIAVPGYHTETLGENNKLRRNHKKMKSSNLNLATITVNLSLQSRHLNERVGCKLKTWALILPLQFTPPLYKPLFSPIIPLSSKLRNSYRYKYNWSIIMYIGMQCIHVRSILPVTCKLGEHQTFLHTLCAYMYVSLVSARS